MAVRGSSFEPFAVTVARTSTPAAEPVAPDPLENFTNVPLESPSAWVGRAPVRLPAAPERVGAIVGGAKTSPTAHDGWLLGVNGSLFPANTKVSDVLGVLPSDGRPVNERVIWVNGIMTDDQLHLADVQALADSGREVVGIRNASGGMMRDLGQCITDKLDMGKNPAVDTAKRAILEAIESGTPLHLFGHSQGALILSRALFDVRNSMLLEKGMSGDEVERALSKLSITTLGGAAASYPDGPKYVHYINNYDMVPLASGLSSSSTTAGKGATIHRFSEFAKPQRMPDLSDGIANFFARLIDRTSHGPQDIYLRRLLQDDAPQIPTR